MNLSTQVGKVGVVADDVVGSGFFFMKRHLAGNPSFGFRLV